MITDDVPTEVVVICFECKYIAIRRDAVGVCHNCGVALCAEHARIEWTPIVAVYGNSTFPAINETVELPRKARLILCGVCQQALEQKHGHVKAVPAESTRSQPIADKAA